MNHYARLIFLWDRLTAMRIKTYRRFFTQFKIWYIYSISEAFFRTFPLQYIYLPFGISTLSSKTIPKIKIEVVNWIERQKEIAQRENVSIKLSGLVTEGNWEAWRSEDFKPYLDQVR